MAHPHVPVEGDGGEGEEEDGVAGHGEVAVDDAVSVVHDRVAAEREAEDKHGEEVELEVQVGDDQVAHEHRVGAGGVAEVLVSGQGRQDQHAADNAVDGCDDVKETEEGQRPGWHNLSYVTLLRLIHLGTVYPLCSLPRVLHCGIHGAKSSAFTNV